MINKRNLISQCWTGKIYVLNKYNQSDELDQDCVDQICKDTLCFTALVYS